MRERSQGRASHLSCLFPAWHGDEMTHGCRHLSHAVSMHVINAREVHEKMTCEVYRSTFEVSQPSDEPRTRRSQHDPLCQVGCTVPLELPAPSNALRFFQWGAILSVTHLFDNHPTFLTSPFKCDLSLAPTVRTSLPCHDSAVSWCGPVRVLSVSDCLSVANISSRPSV